MARLLAEALPVWAGLLKPGGALGLAWNRLHLSPDRLAEIATSAGLWPLRDGPYASFAHRVDSSVHRDVFVARRPPARL